MLETVLDKNQIIAKLSQSVHGKLEVYIPVGVQAAKQDQEFLAHLIAWNERKGQIRDSKTAMPVVSLMVPDFHEEFVENSLAHLGLLSPRDFLKALRFSREHKTRWKKMKSLTAHYLRSQESNWGHFERAILFHRSSVRELYALAHVKPAPIVDRILFKGQYPSGTVFNTVRNLKDMSPMEAAGAIITKRLPFLMLGPILGPKLKEPALLMALIQRMSPTELVTNTKMLEKLGVRSIPEARAAFEEGLRKVSSSKANILKTTKAAEAMDEDNPIRQKLLAVQEKQIEASVSVEGDWLILADKSSSMGTAIEVSRHVAGFLARAVKGRVHLVFFDTVPRAIEVTGKTLEEIKHATRHVVAGGSTSIGCGLQLMLEAHQKVDGICVVSDMAENQLPQLAAVYEVACKLWGTKPPVYLYHLSGEDNPIHVRTFMANIRMVTDPVVFDLQGANVDYYALPNLAKTMRVKRFDMVEEIMASRLLTRDMTMPLGA